MSSVGKEEEDDDTNEEANKLWLYFWVGRTFFVRRTNSSFKGHQKENGNPMRKTYFQANFFLESSP